MIGTTHPTISTYPSAAVPAVPWGRVSRGVKWGRPLLAVGWGQVSRGVKWGRPLLAVR